VQLGIGEEGGRNPLRVPIRAIVVDGDNGAGAPFKNQQLLVTLVADKIVAALEGEFLMTPNEVGHPRACGDGRRSSIGVVLKKVLEVELRAAVDRDSDGIGKLGAGIVGEDLGPIVPSALS